MKKLLFALSFAWLLNVAAVQAQNIVALHSAGEVTLFAGVNGFSQAHTAAVDGDTLYISGGAYNGTTFSKRLIVFGAGYNPLYTTATQPTLITTTVNLTAGASLSHFEGVEFMAPVNFADNNEVTGVSFRRVRFSSTISAGTTTSGTNNSFTECVFISSVQLNALVNTVVSNSLLQGTLQLSNGGMVANSIFLASSGYSSSGYAVIPTANGVLVENCIFLATGAYDNNIIGSSAGQGNIVRNCIFQDASPILGAFPIVSNLYTGVDLSTLMVLQTGSSFSYDHDYHLQNPELYPGVDGTPCGVYGGMFPLKEGGVPITPHITSVNVAPTTTTEGLLNVEIEVEAQQN